ncbi:hypothetical protein D3Y57_09865 [Sphingomonas paeninsulae]|uniref:Uncharacterized protein n=2 Tax=Sphingomonas paeninsulae TaxID=2319844 RepID=A0A494TK65_SPHPE|nr:hypothetical protein D3Y57_09865 [Sphingomonas paeninsulae]
MEARHAKEGVGRWHVDRVPGATDEQIAGEMNKLARHMSDPRNAMAGRLRGEAFLLNDSAICALNRSRFNGTAFESVALAPREMAIAKREQRLAELLIEAAALLEQPL